MGGYPFTCSVESVRLPVLRDVDAALCGARGAAAASGTGTMSAGPSTAARRGMVEEDAGTLTLGPGALAPKALR